MFWWLRESIEGMHRTPCVCARVAVTRWHVVGAAGAHQSIRLSLAARRYVQIISSEWFIIAFVPFRVGTVDLHLGSEESHDIALPSQRAPVQFSSQLPSVPCSFHSRHTSHVASSFTSDNCLYLFRVFISFDKISDRSRSLCRRQQHVPSPSYVHSCFHSEYRLTWQCDASTFVSTVSH